MSSSKIDLLKKKPIPQKKRDIVIELPKPIKKIKVDIEIKDKRGVIKVNRKLLLEKMKLAPPRPLDELPKTAPKPVDSKPKRTIKRDKRKVFTLKNQVTRIARGSPGQIKLLDWPDGVGNSLDWPDASPFIRQGLN